MNKGPDINSVYRHSENVVAREIEGELIIVPLTSGIGDAEDELYTLNRTGRAIWERLDGKTSLADVAKKLSAKFEAPRERIEKDALGLAGELLKRSIIVET